MSAPSGGPSGEPRTGSGARLFPAPRKILGPDVTVRHRHRLRTTRDSGLPAQGYSVIIDDAGAELRHADDAGLRYGHQVIDQLSAPDGSLPSVAIWDHPDFETRGFMLDVSRDRVPTRQTLGRLVAALAACRYNQLQLYVEHTFAYRDHQDVWAGSSPLDAADMRWLDDRCAEVGIELVANQNCFGHLGPWLALDSYRQRAECPDGFEVAPGVRFPPAVLAPTAENAELVLSLVREQSVAMESTTVNIGCDETFELGMGVSAGRVRELGRAAVYLEHLRRIIDPLVAEGRRVQFWADIVARHPEHLGEVPSDGTIALVWNYDGPEAPTLDVPAFVTEILDTLGIDLNADTRFAERLRPFVGSGLDFWVAPGTSSWNSVVGRIDNAYANLADAAAAGVAAGASGYLVTDWGDGGHHQPLTVSLAPIAFGGAMSWCGISNAGVDVATVVDELLLGVAGLGVGSIVERIGGVAERTGLVARNSSPIFTALIPSGFTITGSGEPDLVEVGGVLSTLDEVIAELAELEPTPLFGADLIEELAVAVELARFGARSLEIRAGAQGPDPAERAEYLDELIQRYRRAWRSTSRPGGLDRSAAHLEATRDALLSEGRS